MSIDTYSFYRNRSSLQFCVFDFQGFVLLLKFLSGISKILWKKTTFASSKVSFNTLHKKERTSMNLHLSQFAVVRSCVEPG